MFRFKMLTCLPSLTWLACMLVTGATLAQGTILYNKINDQGSYTIWQINPDGTGDQQLPVAGAYPAWSWDGQLVALSSPVQPTVVSWNVFVYNPQDGTVQQVTDFQDSVQGDESTISFPYFKAFAPDGQRIAVSVLMHSQSSDAHTDTPFLLIYGLDGSFQALVCVGSEWPLGRGSGIDWSPVEDMLVYPFDAQVIAQGLGGSFPVTALYRMAPVEDALGTGQYQQLTFPAAYQDYTTAIWQMDYGPAISPDGQRVAYIRSTASFVHGMLQFATPSIRIVNMDGTNDHQVASAAQGLCITRVSWSPDGTQFVFDLGNQASYDGFPESGPDAYSMMLFTIQEDGSNPQPLQAAPALAPSWNPAGIGIQLPPGP